MEEVSGIFLLAFASVYVFLITVVTMVHQKSLRSWIYFLVFMVSLFFVYSLTGFSFWLMALFFGSAFILGVFFYEVTAGDSFKFFWKNYIQKFSAYR